MNIRNPRELKSFAAERLSNARDVKRIVLIYAGVTIGLSALVTIITYALSLQIDQLGGLKNMSLRSTLSTFQSVLPMVQGVVSLCVNVGFLAAMLRVARGQYTSPQTLRLGFDRFWVLLRSSMIQGLYCVAVVMIGVYVGIMIFMISPLSNGVVELLVPYVQETSVLDSGIVLDDAVYAQFYEMIWPAYLICGGVICLLGLPLLYSYRMVNYVIIDHPGMGAMAALRESKKMMQGNRLQLFKVDLSLWWYYLALAAASVVCYGDMILPLLGVSLPWSEDVSYFLFYGLYLILDFVICYTMAGRVETTYALAYDSVKPEEKKDNGVVLGNIFQM